MVAETGPVKPSDIPLAIDPRMPPGAFAIRSGREQVLSVSERTYACARQAVSDQMAEDCRSVIESAPWIVRYDEHGPAIICECCGTQVALMPERLVDERDAAWLPGFWEPDAGRKHTRRRCEWWRAQRLGAS
jgi:hypothetical protein